jgi:NhaP-type Na+/H+ or K+/H+ antiporter
VAIRRLISIGSLITMAGAALAARVLLGWDGRTSLLFGTLVIVTGPTVIGPLLRRIKLKKKLKTLLEAEGVLIDPVGAIVAVVALDVALQPSFSSLAMGLVGVVATLGSGILVGFAGGWLITLMLRPHRLIPEGLENTFALSMVLLLFHVSNFIAAEAGIAAVTVAGVVVGNTRHRSLRDLMEFKEQLTVLLIGMLFVILAADVRFAELQELGWAGVGVVLFLMLVVRPLNILACTWGTGFTGKEKAFLSWIAPRGIVAAAVASFFAVELDRNGLPGGSSLRAMVFLVIAITVTVQGLSGGFIAQLLGVRLKTRGLAILGASPLARAVGRALRDGGEDVLFLDSNADQSHAAETEGFRVIFGNGLEESTMLRAGLDGLAGCLALTPNEEVNTLFVRRAREEFKIPRAWVALHSKEGHVTKEMVHDVGAAVLFGTQKDLTLWDSCVRRGFGRVERWQMAEDTEKAEESPLLIPAELENAVLPLVAQRGARVTPPDGSAARKGDTVAFLIFEPRRDEVEAWLTAGHWAPALAADASAVGSQGEGGP